MSHTPGPLKPVRSLTCGHLLAGHNMNCDPKKEWSEDDLRLIESAPKLLDALREARSDLIAEHGIFGYRVNFQYIDDAIELAGER